MKITQQAQERHVLNVIVDNEPGILAKITGMFTARGYNIDSLTVADISEDHAISRITIVTRGPEPVIDQIRAQLAAHGTPIAGDRHYGAESEPGADGGIALLAHWARFRHPVEEREVELSVPADLDPLPAWLRG